MSGFEWAIPIVLEREGGLVQDPHDPGGVTNYGISLRWLSRLPIADILPLDHNRNGVMDAEDVRTLTREQAVELYHRYFWEPHRYERIHAQAIANKVFDLSVNAGSHASHTALQWALRAAGQSEVMVDGLLGDHTLQAVNTTEPAVLLAALRSEMAGYYRLLHQPHFEAGWLKRAYA